MGTDLYHDHSLVPDFNRLNPSPTAPKIIGLSGRAKSGKNTVGEIINTLYGHSMLSFAAPLKEALYRLNPVAAFPGSDRVDVRSLVDDLGWDDAKEVNAKSPYGVRGLLQRLGTDVGRSLFGEDFWVNLAWREVTSDGQFVFTDVRFPNEALSIVSSGGVVLRVNRPDLDGVLPHPSEVALDNWDFDGYIENDGSLLDLQGTVMIALGDL